MAEVTQSPNFPSKRTPQAEEVTQEQAQSTERLLDTYTAYKNANLSEAGKKEFFKDYPEYEASFAELDKQPAPFDVPYEERAAIEGAMDPTKMAQAFEQGGYRDILKNVSPNSLADMVTYLRKNIPGHTFITHLGEVWSRPSGSSEPWRPMDPGFMDSLKSGDMWELAKETGRDIREVLPDVATGLLKEGAGMAAGGLTAATTFNPALALAAYAGTKGVLGAGEEALRQRLGKALGVNTAYDPTKMGLYGGLEALTSGLVGRMMPSQFMKSGIVSSTLKDKIWQKVADTSGLTRAQFDLLPDAEIAQMGAGLFKGGLGKVRETVDDTFLNIVGGYSGVKNISSLKTYLDTDKSKLPISEDAKVAAANEIKRMGDVLKDSSENLYNEAYKKADDIINKQGVSFQEIYHSMLDFYKKQSAAYNATNKEGTRQALKENMEATAELFTNVMDSTFAKSPRGAFMRATEGRAPIFFDAVKGEYIGEPAVAKAGGFKATSADISALSKKLSEMRGESFNPLKEGAKTYSPEVKGMARGLLKKINEISPPEQRVADKAYQDYMRMLELTQPVTGPETLKQSSTSGVQSFIQQAARDTGVPKEGMQLMAEVAKKAGTPEARLAYQTMQDTAEKLAATNLQPRGSFWGLGYNPQAVLAVGGGFRKGAGALADLAETYGRGGVGPAFLQSPSENIWSTLAKSIAMGGGSQAGQKGLAEYLGFTAPQANTLDEEELRRLNITGGQ